MRRLGATKIQIGVQSLDDGVRRANGRAGSVESVARAFELSRAFGFKIHAHLMPNLLGAAPAGDKADWVRLATDARFMPDEAKLYPCALVAGTGLVERYKEGSWRPYTEEELIDIMGANMRATPEFMRISRMVRDISATDILVGNKKGNLRQAVEASCAPGEPIAEIRHREIGAAAVDASQLSLAVHRYRTSNTREAFLEWVAPGNKIAGFLRLSLPDEAYVRAHEADLPIQSGQAMIREVHIYGRAVRIGARRAAAQHLGLGRALIARACEIARAEGFSSINVISAVGTRAYYRRVGFEDAGLYQCREL